MPTARPIVGRAAATPLRLLVGHDRSPVVVVDAIGGDPAAAIAAAAALAPFPAPANAYYPGLRRVIGEGDGAAWAYVEALLEAAAPFVGGGFDTDGFDLIEASFSMVTAAPAALSPAQRAPHFDSPDPGYLALLHYLSDTPGTGTAFFRQRSTGIERVEEASLSRFVAAARAESGGAGYIAGSDDRFEEIGRVEARPGRLVIYRGQLLHSGLIPADMAFSDDPRRGRLTANIFVQAHRR